jgi:hypothetical protein
VRGCANNETAVPEWGVNEGSTPQQQQPRITMLHCKLRRWLLCCESIAERAKHGHSWNQLKPMTAAVAWRVGHWWWLLSNSNLSNACTTRNWGSISIMFWTNAVCMCHVRISGVLLDGMRI